MIEVTLQVQKVKNALSRHLHIIDDLSQFSERRGKLQYKDLENHFPAYLKITK